MKKFALVFFLSTGLLFFQTSRAQQTAVYLDVEAGYKTGLDLFNKQKYGAAQKEFEKTLEEKSLAPGIRDNCEFYAAWCASLLFHREAEYLLITYLDNHPVSPNRQRATIEL